MAPNRGSNHESSSLTQINAVMICPLEARRKGTADDLLHGAPSAHRLDDQQTDRPPTVRGFHVAPVPEAGLGFACCVIPLLRVGLLTGPGTLRACSGSGEPMVSSWHGSTSLGASPGLWDW